jgi:uncharacterized protein (TIGR00369 family)
MSGASALAVGTTPKRKIEEKAVTDEAHHRKLEQLYAVAPVTRWFGAAIRISDGQASVRIPVRPEFSHAAGGVHGSIYFRALDDAAFFAANSRVMDVLVLTVSFTVHFTAPVRDGEVRAEGRVVHEAGRLLVAESELRDEDGRLLAKGSGIFTRSRIPLTTEIGYADPGSPG